MNYELNRDTFKVGKEIEEITDLISAYSFAQNQPLTEANFLKAHETFSKTFLVKSKRGGYRIEPVGVFGKSGLAYMALEPAFVVKEMEAFFASVQELLAAKLTQSEVFYFASFMHLRFAHIHPFRDGNGRAARLLEKWFVAQKLGKEFWRISSEEFYKKHQQAYYDALNLGVNFYELDYGTCLPLLKLLPSCLV